MSRGEEIISKATPNFLYNFLTKWSSDEPYFCDDGINLICISQKKSDDSNRTFFLKVVDGTLPSEYFGFLVRTFKTENNDFNCTKKYIKVNGLKILHYQGIPFISTQHLEIKQEIIDFDLELYIKNLNLKNINKRLEKSHSENNQRVHNNHQNEHDEVAGNRRGVYSTPNEPSEQNLKSNYERFRAYNENLSAEQNARNYNCSYNDYVKMYGPNSGITAIPPSSNSNSERVTRGFHPNSNHSGDFPVPTGKDKNIGFNPSDMIYNKQKNSFFENNSIGENGMMKNVPIKTEDEMFRNVRKGFENIPNNSIRVYDNSMEDGEQHPRITNRIPGHDVNRMQIDEGSTFSRKGAFGSNGSNQKEFYENNSYYKGNRNNLDETNDMFPDHIGSIPSKDMKMYDMESGKYEKEAINKYRNRDVNNPRSNNLMHEKYGRTEEFSDNVKNVNRFSDEKDYEGMGNYYAGSIKGEERVRYDNPNGRNFNNTGRQGNANYDESYRKGNSFYEERDRGGREENSFVLNQEKFVENRNISHSDYKEQEKNTKVKTNSQLEGAVDETILNRPNKAEKLMKDNTVGRSNRKVAPYHKSTVLKTTEGMMMPIKKLSQYCSKWVIKARVQLKDGIRKFTTQNKEGQLFTIELCDESGEIRASFFGKAVDKWYNYIEEGKIYVISKGSIKPKNKKYNMLNHDCELFLDENSFIELSEETDMIPKCMYNFTTIDQIKNMSNDTFVDVIGIVYGFQELTRVFVKRAEEYRNKRNLVLLDESNETISVSLWGEHAAKLEDKDLENKCVICFKGAKIKEWQGKKLESSNLTKIEVNPDIERAYNLKKWWMENKNNVNNLIAVKTNKFSIESQISIGRMQEYITSVCAGESADRILIFTILGMVEHFYNTSPVYPACPKCNKKMTSQNMDAGDGTGSGVYIGDAEGSALSDSEQDKVFMFCAKCQKDDLPVYNYSLNIKISDSTNSIKASAFANSAKTIMNGLSADEFVQLRDRYISEQNIGNFDLIERSKFNEFFFRIKVHIASQVDEFKTNYTILEAIPLEKVLSDSCKYLIKSVKSFSKDEENAI